MSFLQMYAVLLTKLRYIWALLRCTANYTSNYVNYKLMCSQNTYNLFDFILFNN